MDIRINTLTLHNFKGVLGERTYTFDGRNVRIEGDNGTGKSTVFDAFTWLLFGKDHQGRDWTNFNIKPIDPATKETIHHLDSHWVEGKLTVGGVAKTLRRVVTEEWVKPKGETERVLKGHTQAFFIDGVDTGTKKNYDLAIHQWIDEDVFRIVTNPLYFIDDRFTSWEVRRKILLASVGYDANSVAGDFADLLAEMKGVPMEQFRKSVAAAKRAQREELAKATANIDAWNAALPEAQDTAGIDAEIKRLEAERDADVAALHEAIASVDADLAKAADASRAPRDLIARKNAQILALQEKMGKYIGEALGAQTRENRARLSAISEASAEVDSEEAAIGVVEKHIHVVSEKLAAYRQGRADEASRLTELGRRYEAEKTMAFSPDVETACPHCGRPYPVEDLEAKRGQRKAEWLAARKSAMADIQQRVPAIRDEIRRWDDSIAAATKDLDDSNANLKDRRTNLLLLKDKLAAAQAVPVADAREAELRARKSQEYQDLTAQVDALNADIDSLSASITAPEDRNAERSRLTVELFQRKERFDCDVRPLLDAKAVEGERQRMLGMIREEEDRRAVFADELARLERLEVRTQQYIKASVDACEEKINAIFKIARWRMFDRTLEGGIVEMCEVTTPEGVPYRSMNDAMRILCGLDAIRVLSEVNGVQAPIFIDNAESVTRADFGTPAQVVRLVVKAGSELTVIPE